MKKLILVVLSILSSTGYAGRESHGITGVSTICEGVSVFGDNVKVEIFEAFTGLKAAVVVANKKWPLFACQDLTSALGSTTQFELTVQCEANFKGKYQLELYKNLDVKKLQMWFQDSNSDSEKTLFAEMNCN